MVSLIRRALQLVEQDCLLLTLKKGAHLFLLLLNFVFLDDEGHCLQLNHVLAGADDSQKEYYDGQSSSDEVVLRVLLAKIVGQVLLVALQRIVLSVAHNVAYSNEEWRGHNQRLVELVDWQEHDDRVLNWNFPRVKQSRGVLIYLLQNGYDALDSPLQVQHVLDDAVLLVAIENESHNDCKNCHTLVDHLLIAKFIWAFDILSDYVDPEPELVKEPGLENSSDLLRVVNVDFLFDFGVRNLQGKVVQQVVRFLAKGVLFVISRYTAHAH